MNAYNTARRASKLNKNITASLKQVQETVANYENEILEIKKRLAVLEAAEWEQDQKELLKVEEHAMNHGRDKSYFKVPNLSTR